MHIKQNFYALNVVQLYLIRLRTNGQSLIEFKVWVDAPQDVTMCLTAELGSVYKKKQKAHEKGNEFHSGLIIVTLLQFAWKNHSPEDRNMSTLLRNIESEYRFGQGNFLTGKQTIKQLTSFRTNLFFKYFSCIPRGLVTINGCTDTRDSFYYFIFSDDNWIGSTPILKLLVCKTLFFWL